MLESYESIKSHIIEDYEAAKLVRKPNIPLLAREFDMPRKGYIIEYISCITRTNRPTTYKALNIS